MTKAQAVIFAIMVVLMVGLGTGLYLNVTYQLGLFTESMGMAMIGLSFLFILVPLLGLCLDTFENLWSDDE